MNAKKATKVNVLAEDNIDPALHYKTITTDTAEKITPQKLNKFCCLSRRTGTYKNVLRLWHQAIDFFAQFSEWNRFGEIAAETCGKSLFPVS